jgi:hypothetical protein
MDQEKKASSLSWTVQEFEQKERHPDWLWTVGLVFGLAAVVSFFYGNIFFGIFLVIAGIVVIIYALQKPKLLAIRIEEKGVMVNEELIPFEKTIQFWLDETGKPDKLLLQVKGSFVPIISLPLEGVDAATIRNTLAPHLKESFLRESRSIALFDRFGF